MVLVMKLISLAFDLDKGVTSRPNILEYFGFSVSVSSVIFGPFMTYSDYCQILARKRMVRDFNNFPANFLVGAVLVPRGGTCRIHDGGEGGQTELHIVNPKK